MPKPSALYSPLKGYLGYHGQEIFAAEGPKTNIRMVTLLFIAYDQLSTLANSNVHQFEDIVGKKVASGPSGSGTAQTLERLAKAAGIWGEFTADLQGWDSRCGGTPRWTSCCLPVARQRPE